MIQSLYIKNYALIDELEIALGPGLNILTGQTGAGKSIIIGALNAVLGERADTDTVREGTRKAVVEAVLRDAENPDPYVAEVLERNGIDRMNGEIILRREIRSGGSRAFVNDTPVTLAVLRSVGDRLVDLHGQHDHQMLLREDHHREVVDALPDVQRVIQNYRASFDQVNALRKEREALYAKERDLRDKMDQWRFQLQELEAVDLDEETFEAMQAEMKRLDHAEELDRKAVEIAELGSGSSTSLMEHLARVQEALEHMAGIEEVFQSYVDELESARVSIQELINFAEQYRSRIEFNPERLEELRSRQTEVRRLEKKYQRSLPDLGALRSWLRSSVEQAEQVDLDREKVEKKLAAATEKLIEMAKKLHRSRIAAGEELAGHISETLADLGIDGNQFQTRVVWRYHDKGWIRIDGKNVDTRRDGPDEVAFHISTNRGESPRPLARIASGGEISRVMLAMKSVIARERHLPVMVFDEIDTGIGGAVAEKVGQRMKQLARHCQIIAITHQVQIAGQADHHFKVEKQETEERTATYIRPLDEEDHIHEIAGLMSGAEISDHAIASAREMVCRARKFRE